jgi:hypothetical protein
MIKQLSAIICAVNLMPSVKMKWFDAVCIAGALCYGAYQALTA